MRLNSIDNKIPARIQALLSKGYEVNAQPLYHFKEVAGAADGSKTCDPSYKFFSLAVGQEQTSKEDTNMGKASVIAKPDEMWVQSLRFVVMPSKTDNAPILKAFDKAALEKHILNDMGRFLNRGVVSVNQMGRTILEMSPMFTCPSGFGTIAPSVAGFDTNVSSGTPLASVPLMSNARPIDLYLASEMSFEVKIDFPAGVFPVYNNLRIGFILEGFYARPQISSQVMA